MKSRFVCKWPLAVAIGSIVVASVGTPVSAGPVVYDENGQVKGSSSYFALNYDAFTGQTPRYIVRFTEAPLALYGGELDGLAAAPYTTSHNGRSRLNTKSAEARAYVEYLKNQQNDRLNSMAALLGRSVAPRYQFQYALNAVVVELASAEVKKIANMPGVAAVERDKKYTLATDIGPGFIGAPALWWGQSATQDTLLIGGFDTPPNESTRGEGIVVGDIDSGYNSLSPSFAETDETGYTIENPLGDGIYLGQCAEPDISLAGCNSKVIGVYDELHDGITDPYSVEDIGGHGSHTASTMVGNGRHVSLSEYDTHISGVMPHANLVVFYACEGGFCDTAATTSAVEHAVQDGVVDVLNYSISGGTNPWSDSTSLAFLSATNAGIFIAASAGNTSTSVPSAIAGTANHDEPWVTTVAASNHTGGPLIGDLDISGTGTPPDVSLFPAFSGTAYAGFTAAIASSDLVLSPNFQNSNTSGTDGCTTAGGYPANTFQNAIAVISRGTCSFAEKATNAINAGAIALVVSDNRVADPTSASFTFGSTTISVPAFYLSQADGTSLSTYLTGNPGATAEIPYSTSRYPVNSDQLASFSLLGPADINVVKPDVQAPGVKILAAVANDNTTDGPNLLALYNGTSMSAPHTTGAGALLMAHHDWTPMEIKSALMMTATQTGLTKADGTTPSDAFDRGAGSIRVDVATQAGLVLNETGTRFTRADPALADETNYVDPTKLNLASLQNNTCLTASGVSCTFVRTFRNTQPQDEIWTATLNGLSGTVSPSGAFTVFEGGSQSVQVEVDSSGFNADGEFNFGELVLTPTNTDLPTLHLPVAVAVPAPEISTVTSLTITIPNSATTQNVSLDVENSGGPTLNVDNTNVSGTGYAYVVVNQPSDGSSGYYAAYFTDFASGAYAADDFVITEAGANLGRIVLPGFVYPTTEPAISTLTGHMIHFQVYADTNNQPNGDPESITSVNAPVWSFDATIGSTTGLSVSSNTITLDLTAAGELTNLAAGTYWLVAYVDMGYVADGGWVWFLTTDNTGNTGTTILPVDGETEWSAIPEATGFAMLIEQEVTCGAPWLSTNPGTLNVAGLSTAQLTVTADSTNFSSGSSATGYLCLHSNDAETPTQIIQVQATQQ